MRVITLTGSPRFPSPASALLEYAREALSRQEIDVCHWHIQNFTPEDLWLSRRISPALQTFQEQLASAGGIMIATPALPEPLPGLLQRLIATFPPGALDHKVVLPLVTGEPLLPPDTGTPLFTTLGARRVLPVLYARHNQIADYQHSARFSPDLQRALDNALGHFTRALSDIAEPAQ
ncbi:NADPH-dependent FMN reductase [Shimwellia pseudoproteus]|uniref:NAD(P)H-dependent oxidoreductase n=1 Tax=Shimwellia pseudoproteus TaxID=570012 RepID=UPI0018ED842F|nr:NAD(P)H-dependent oxidoreductase [Shimwellia pseudoproteus]MBJ3815280.1 NADPH-dependent FMN reductase [Shimwellia pseudoproteus]